MFTHKQIWEAIDNSASRAGLSASALAVKAGLSATSFNPSKRFINGRERWPSTETISRILNIVGGSFDDFLTAPKA